jgi:hypothetical protein
MTSTMVIAAWHPWLLLVVIPLGIALGGLAVAGRLLVRMRRRAPWLPVAAALGFPAVRRVAMVAGAVVGGLVLCFVVLVVAMLGGL